MRFWYPAAAGAGYLVAGSAAVLGDACPVHDGFVGGFGQSPIVGSALALDWVSMPAATCRRGLRRLRLTTA